MVKRKLLENSVSETRRNTLDPERLQQIGKQEAWQFIKRGRGVPQNVHFDDEDVADLLSEATTLYLYPQIADALQSAHHPEAYYRSVVRNHLGRKAMEFNEEKIGRLDLNKFTLSIDEGDEVKDFFLNNLPDPKAIIPGKGMSDQELEELKKSHAIPFIELNEKEWLRFSGDFRMSLETSLEFIYRIYKARLYLRNPQNIESKILRIARLIGKTKIKAWRILGTDINKKNPRYIELRIKRNENCLLGEERKEFNEILRQNADISAFDKIEQLEHDLLSRADPTKSTFDPAFLLIEQNLSSGWTFDWFFLSDLNIEPARMIFDVWRKSSEFKRGETINLKKMESVFWYLKNKYRGSRREFLFESIRKPEDIKKNLRLYQYRKMLRERLYSKIVKSIFEISFIEEINIKNPTEIMTYIQSRLPQGKFTQPS